MIIIKSQCGNLTDVSHVEPEFENGVIFGFMKGTSSRSLILGQGYSKERVKEVMKEIEEHIRVLYASKMIAEICSLDEVDGVGERLFMKEAIYTMPKE